MINASFDSRQSRCGSGRCVWLTAVTLPVCRRPEGNCSRWSAAPLRSACGATLRIRQTWSSSAATRRASQEPRSRTGREIDSSKRNQVVSGVWQADPHSPCPFSLCASTRANYSKPPFITRDAVWWVSSAPLIVSALPRGLLPVWCRYEGGVSGVPRALFPFRCSAVCAQTRCRRSSISLFKRTNMVLNIKPRGFSL